MEQTTNTMFSQLTQLRDAGKINDEDWEGILSLKDNAFGLTMAFKSKEGELIVLKKELELKAKAENCFYDEHPEWIGFEENQKDLKDILTKLGYKTLMKKVRFDNEKDEEGKPLHPTTNELVIDRNAVAYLLELVEKDKERVEKEYQEKNKPKSKTTKTRKTRGKFEGEIRWVNTKETAEGKDNEFYFKGDEEAIMSKPTFTAKDGSYKNMKYKAIKSVRYLGGEKSKEDDEFCNGICIWDRATGSKAIADTGLSPALFKVRCGELKADGSIYCSKCQGKEENFFH